MHKKRTGKAFVISEEIVANDETYEEEGLIPRSHRLSTRFGINSNVNDLSLSKNETSRSSLLASASIIRRENETNRLFSQTFPAINNKTNVLIKELCSNKNPPSFTASSSDDLSENTPHETWVDTDFDHATADKASELSATSLQEKCPLKSSLPGRSSSFIPLEESLLDCNDLDIDGNLDPLISELVTSPKINTSTLSTDTMNIFQSSAYLPEDYVIWMLSCNL